MSEASLHAREMSTRNTTSENDELRKPYVEYTQNLVTAEVESCHALPLQNPPVPPAKASTTGQQQSECDVTFSSATHRAMALQCLERKSGPQTSTLQSEPRALHNNRPFLSQNETKTSKAISDIGNVNWMIQTNGPAKDGQKNLDKTGNKSPEIREALINQPRISKYRSQFQELETIRTLSLAAAILLIYDEC
ncbi:hypothetical protein STEG23_006675 [Scotinomys teguina]